MLRVHVTASRSTPSFSAGLAPNGSSLNHLSASGVSVAGLVLRVAAWFVGYRWVRAQHEDVGAYTLAFFGVFVVALCLEMTYVLVVARGQRRGAT